MSVYTLEKRTAVPSKCLFLIARVHDLYLYSCILFQLSSYWWYERSRCSLEHSGPACNFPAEYQWTLQGAFEINHSTLLLADSSTTYSFFCPYHIILLLLFMNGSASFMPHIPQLSEWICSWHRCKSFNRRPGAVVEGSEMWKETPVISNRIKPGPPPALHQNVNIWASFYPWKDQLREKNREAFFLKQIYHQSTLRASVRYFSGGIPSLTFMCKKQEILLGWVWLRFSFKSYWHHVQWPCNLWELLGPVTEVVKHLDWLGRYEMCAVTAYCRLSVRAACRELLGLALSQINYSTQSN